jgi:hypothetical protein
MRLPLIPPSELSLEQRSLYDDMHEGISKSFQGFIAMPGGWHFDGSLEPVAP